MGLDVALCSARGPSGYSRGYPLYYPLDLDYPRVYTPKGITPQGRFRIEYGPFQKLNDPIMWILGGFCWCIAVVVSYS